ncbi:MAG: hypothetical protein ACJ8CR_30635 [Roseiflexaceae bacterium]
MGHGDHQRARWSIRLVEHGLDADLVLDHHAGIAQRGLEPRDLAARLGNAAALRWWGVGGAMDGDLAQQGGQPFAVGGQ